MAPQYFDPNLIPRSLDAVYNAYLARQQQQRQAGSDLLSTGGIDPSQVTPEAFQQAQAPAGGGEDPIVGAIRSHLERKKQSQGLADRDTESQIAARSADAALKLRAAGRTQTERAPTVSALVDPVSGNPIPGVPQGKMLPPASVLALNEGKAVARMLPEVETALQEAGPVMGPVRGRAGQANPYDTKSQTLDARFRTASQAFGRFMEGGVLRKEDEEKYRKMFPQLSDKQDVARNKLSIVRRMLAQKYEDDRVTLGRSGYDVGGFEQLDIPASIFGQGAPSGDIQIRTLRDGSQVRVRRMPDGSYEEVQ